MASNPVFVTAINWIPRGRAAELPQTVELEPSTIKDLIDASNLDDETSDTADDTVEEKKGLRGSKKGGDAPKSKNPDDKFNMEDYDKEQMAGPTMKGLAVFSKPSDDPYITSHNDDSEDERETDAMKIRATDNLIVAAKFDGEDTTLMVYVCSLETGDLYVHHDYPIAAPVLCLENIGYDPGVDSKKGNLLAVSTMDPQIEIWDLDVINAVKPVVKLGSTNKSNRKKRDGSEQGHTDSVLSLSWNREADHLLASGGADQMVVLWDLDSAKPAQNLPLFNGMVQTLEWQPLKSSILLSGTRGGELRLDDGRLNEPVAIWDFANGTDVEVERACWDRHHEHNAYALTNDGKLRYIDTRQPGQSISTVQVYEGEDTGALSLSSMDGLLATIGGESAKFWKNVAGEIQLIGQKKFHMGTLRCISFCSDQPNIVVLGGQKEDLIYVYDVARDAGCSKAFPNLHPSADINPLDKDTNIDVEMNDD